MPVMDARQNVWQIQLNIKNQGYSTASEGWQREEKSHFGTSKVQKRSQFPELMWPPIRGPGSPEKAGPTPSISLWGQQQALPSGECTGAKAPADVPHVSMAWEQQHWKLTLNCQLISAKQACTVMDAPAAPNRGKWHPALIAMCVSHTPTWGGLAAGREGAGKRGPVVKSTPLVVLHCPLPSTQSCLSEHTRAPCQPQPLGPGWFPVFNPCREGEQQLERLWNAQEDKCGLGIYELTVLAENCCPFMISQNMNPESSTTGELGACWHLFYREQELTAIHPPEFPGGRILFRTLFSMFQISLPIKSCSSRIGTKCRKDTTTLSSQWQNIIFFALFPAERNSTSWSIAHPTEPSFITCLSLRFHIRFTWRTL